MHYLGDLTDLEKLLTDLREYHNKSETLMRTHPARGRLPWRMSMDIKAGLKRIDLGLVAALSVLEEAKAQQLRMQRRTQ